MYILVHVCVVLYVSLHCVFCVRVAFKQYISTACIIHLEALYEKKQAIMVYEDEIAKLQALVETSKASSAEKDTLIAKYETIVKESEGKNIGYYKM